MTKTAGTVDYEGSYLLGEADGEMWANHAHPNETQAAAMLQAEEIGQRDVFGQENASWLREQSESYQQQDPHFDGVAYFEGFLASVRRARQVFVFAAAGVRRGR
jgi:hypothetical protein